MKRIGYYIALFTLVVVYFVFGLLKWNYILNPGIAKGSFLLYRYSKEAQANYNASYSDPIRYFLYTPKWISAIIYGNIFLLLNVLIIYLVYKNEKYVKFTFWLFFIVSLSSFLVLGLGLLFHRFDIVYPLVSRIKELQQSPFTLILLLAAYRLYKDK